MHTVQAIKILECSNFAKPKKYIMSLGYIKSVFSGCETRRRGLINTCNSTLSFAFQTAPDFIE